MENLAAIVTKKAIIDALEEAFSKNLKLIPSTKFHIIYKNKHFPPKEIVRLAAKKMGIGNIGGYRLNGGDSTNRHLIDKGFTIEQFRTWAITPEINNSPIKKSIVLNFSSDDFLKALHAKAVLGNRRIKVLKAFAEFPGYKACNKDIAAITPYKPNFINLIFGHLAKPLHNILILTILQILIPGIGGQ